MHASIEGEDEEGCGLEVVDNNGVEHWFEIKYEKGNVSYYEQDGYPDETDRTDEEDIRIEQAMYHAQWYVQRERGYRTFEPRFTPEWLAHVLGILFSLEFDTFERHFGDYAQQYQSALRPDIEPVIDGSYWEADGGIVFRADVFTGLDFQRYLDAPGDFDPVDIVGERTDDYDIVTRLSERATEGLDESADPITEVSDLDVFYQTRSMLGSVTEQSVGQRTHSQAGPADAQLQMTPPQTTLEQELPIGIVQGLVLHHLQCQVRDAYLRLGMEPPKPFRILGQGLYRQTIRYQYLDLYEPYHLTDADIEGYRAPGLDTDGVKGGALAASSGGSSLSELLTRRLFDD